MVEYISSSSDIATNNSLIQQKQELSAVSLKKNPYSSNSDNSSISDNCNISDAAQSLYEKEQEIEKYKKMVLSSDDDTYSSVSDVADWVSNGEYISNDELAGSMVFNNDFWNNVFSSENVG